MQKHVLLVSWQCFPQGLPFTRFTVSTLGMLYGHVIADVNAAEPGSAVQVISVCYSNVTGIPPLHGTCT